MSEQRRPVRWLPTGVTAVYALGVIICATSFALNPNWGIALLALLLAGLGSVWARRAWVAWSAWSAWPESGDQ